MQNEMDRGVIRMKWNDDDDGNNPHSVLYTTTKKNTRQDKTRQCLSVWFGFFLHSENK